MKISAFMNQKGGVMKTTLCKELAIALARLGYTVGLIDLDPQGHLAALFGALDEYDLPKDGLFNAFNGAPVLSEILEISDEFWSNIKLPDGFESRGNGRILFLPGGRQTAQLNPSDINLLEQVTEPLVSACDIVLVDTPPTASDLSASTLAFADMIIIPSEVDILSFFGIKQILDMRHNLTVAGLIGEVVIGGIIPTRIKENTILYQGLLEQLEQNYPGFIWNDAAIPDSIVWKEAAALQMSVFEHGSRHTASTYGWNFVRRFLQSIGESEIVNV